MAPRPSTRWGDGSDGAEPTDRGAACCKIYAMSPVATDEDMLERPVRFIPPDGEDAEWPEVDDWNDYEWAHWLSEHNKYPYLRHWSTADIAQYLHYDRYTYGWGIKKGLSTPFTWFYKPTPVAVPFHSSKTPNILFGGAAGGSKSHSARHDAYRHALIIPEFRAIIMRRTFQELERDHLDKANSECTKVNTFLGEERFQFLKGDHKVIIDVHGPGRESVILFGHCQNLGDEEKYLGPAYDAFYPDEMATFEKKQIIGVGGRLRSANRKIVATMRGTSNPGGAHTLWLKDYFIDRVEDVIRQENPKYRAERYQFIQAMLWDNPYYMDPDGTYTNYEERLFAYDPERRRQLLMGDWTALAGQFFPEFSVARHVKDLPIPPGCKIERWLDWGYDPHYGMCKWVACLPNGRLYVFYEYKFNGAQARQKMVASEVAARIKRYTLDDVLQLVKSTRVNKTIADPSMWSADGHTGEDYSETFARCGVSLTKADNDRVMGWGRLRHWFRDAPDGLPWIMFHPRCVTSIRTIPGLVRDKSDPDDVDTTGEDHAADACFPADTKVVARRGDVPISLLGVWDEVWTRQGWKKVDAVFRVGVRPTVKITLQNGIQLRGTPDHKVWVEGYGFVPLSYIRYGDMMRTCIPTSSDSTREKHGSRDSGLSPQGTTSTIRMETRQTTASRISSVYPAQFISAFTQWLNQWWRGCVTAVGEAISLGVRGGVDSAPTVVSLSGGETAIPMTLTGDVLGVAGHSGSTDTVKSDSAPVPVHPPARMQDPKSQQSVDGVESRLLPDRQMRCGVLSAVVSVQSEPECVVYNITVDEAHEYFAEGILVANCRYGVMARPTPTVMRLAAPIILAGSIADMVGSLTPSTVRRPGMIS